MKNIIFLTLLLLLTACSDGNKGADQNQSSAPRTIVAGVSLTTTENMVNSEPLITETVNSDVNQTSNDVITVPATTSETLTNNQEHTPIVVVSSPTVETPISNEISTPIIVDTLIANEPNATTISTNQKIFILGDSTVYNESNITEMGWGTAFKDYAIHPENIFNQARSGASSKSYKICDSIPELCYKNHNWDNTKQLIYDTDIGEGAYLLIQFAHNDEKKDDPVKATFPGRGNSFYTELKVFTDEARAMGLIPVLITPVEHMEKNIGEDLKQSHIKSSGDFAQTVRDLATDEDVLLLDLQNKSWNEFNKYRDTTAIMQDFAFDDVSHFSPNGAKIVAGWVKELACASIDKELCAQFK